MANVTAPRDFTKLNVDSQQRVRPENCLRAYTGRF